MRKKSSFAYIIMGSFNFKNKADFNAIKANAEAFYKTIGKVRCPYFQEEIAFNAKGLRHLKFKSDQQARLREEQYARLKLIHLAPEVLKKSHTLQGIWHTRKFEEQKTNSRWERVMREVTFYEFIAVLDNVRMKVIVKKAQGGEKHFWSVIPYWGINKVSSKRVLYSGDLEND